MNRPNQTAPPSIPFVTEDTLRAYADSTNAVGNATLGKPPETAENLALSNPHLMMFLANLARDLATIAHDKSPGLTAGEMGVYLAERIFPEGFAILQAQMDWDATETTAS